MSIDMVEISNQSSLSNNQNAVKIKMNEMNSEDDTKDDESLPLCFQVNRHQKPIEGIACEAQSWRIRERMKTVSVALVLCLNIGVDPPDIVKIQPCARLECWIDPSSMSPQKAMEMIGSNLQKQYERWQPRARYKKFHDPTVDDVKKLCTSLRRNAKEERVLFHYNGHGVPRPTSNGEIWVFNKNYTQYIPLSIYDLQTWMGAPSIYVYDCSNAGIIVNSFNQFAEQHERELEQTIGLHQNSKSQPIITYKNCIQLAACSANQILPMNAELPADLFTSCLTTPIKIALKWYIMQRTSMLVPHISVDLIERIPGKLNDRRTMLGELNWIFTAITDTIAWNTLPRDLFQKLFREDLLVASLFRNFLLAERILRSYDCTPVSSPPLPQGFRHPIWSAWDLAVDLALKQLPDILKKDVPYKQLPFFEEQLTAFQVWLDQGSKDRSPPEQLPIVLQVLLSQVHRLRALELLGRFLDLGPWAVNLALGVGIFPYVLKLLQSSAKELRPVLVFIWAKILAVDRSCQVELVKDHKYFLSVLQDSTVTTEHRTYSAFVLASIVDNYRAGQASALQGSLVSICLVQLCDESWLLRQWLVICLGQLWQNFANARWSGGRDMAHEKLYPLLNDPVPEVRAAVVFALGTYINSVTERSEQADNIDRTVAAALLHVSEDMSPLVRLQLLATLQWMVIFFANQFVLVYQQESVDSNDLRSARSNSYQMTFRIDGNVNMKRVLSSSSIPNMCVGNISTTSPIGFHKINMDLWQGISMLSEDPYPKVAEAARAIIDYISKQAVGMIAKEATTEKYGSSLSLPPSPNTRTNYLEDNPSSALTTPLVITNFIPWTISYFAKSMKSMKADEGQTIDEHSPEYRARMTRFSRNVVIRKAAKAQQRRAIFNRIDSLSWMGKTLFKPYIVKLLPYESQIAVAYKEKVAIHDWSRNTVFSYTPQSCASHFNNGVTTNFGGSLKRTKMADMSMNLTARVTALEFVNAHDVALILVGYKNGVIRIWQEPKNGSGTTKLVTAWRAFPTTNRFSRNKTDTCDLLTTWHQRSQQLIVGCGKLMKIYDVEKELRINEIQTGSDSPLQVLSSSPKELIAAGCSDGSVRLFDKRCSPNEARIMTYREHSGAIITACLRDNCESLVSGCSQGKISLFDIRSHNNSVQSWDVGSDVTSIAVHTSADIVACGSQYISIYGLDGRHHHTLRNEGFMGPKMGATSCLSFHPHNVLLAGGFADNVVAVYVSSCNNRNS